MYYQLNDKLRDLAPITWAHSPTPIAGSGRLSGMHLIGAASCISCWDLEQTNCNLK